MEMLVLAFVVVFACDLAVVAIALEAETETETGLMILDFVNVRLVDLEVPLLCRRISSSKSGPSCVFILVCAIPISVFILVPHCEGEGEGEAAGVLFCFCFLHDCVPNFLGLLELELELELDNDDDDDDADANGIGAG